MISEDIKMQALVEGLNEDLANEYAATIMYTYSAAVVTGFHRQVLKPFFEGEITDESGHALYLADKIRTLGGIPTTTPAPVPQLTDVKDILEAARDAEADTIRRYTKRIAQAEELGLIELKLKLEDLIADETNHKEELEHLLADPRLV